MIASLHDSTHNSNLHDAAAHNKVEIIEELLKLGANVNMKNCFGWSPLMEAAKNKAFEALELLINTGADISQKSLYGVDALFLACASGSLEIVRRLLCDGSANCSETGLLISPMMIASYNGHTEIVDQLCKYRCIQHLHPQIGVTSLMFASAGGSKRLLQLLLSRGAEVDHVNQGGFSASDVSTWFQHKTLTDTLSLHAQKQRGYNDNFDIVEELKNGEIQLVQQILLEDPNRAKFTLRNGVTPLAIAAEFGFDTVSRLLVKCGADINTQNMMNQRTPLMESIYHNNIHIAYFLLQSGANINLMDEHGRKAIDFAYEKLNVPLIRRLKFYENLPEMNKLLKVKLPEINVTKIDAYLSFHKNLSEMKSNQEQNNLYLKRQKEVSFNKLNSYLTSGHLENVLEKEGFHSFVEIFRREEIDWKAFLLLTSEDFIEIGITDSSSIADIIIIKEKLKRTLQYGNLLNGLTAIN